MDGHFSLLYTYTNWWGTTELGEFNGFFYSVNHGGADLGMAAYQKNMGYSVRCVKD